MLVMALSKKIAISESSVTYNIRISFYYFTYPGDNLKIPPPGIFKASSTKLSLMELQIPSRIQGNLQ